MLLPLQLNGLNLDSGTAFAVVAGSFTEPQIVAGGQTIVITLTNDTWIAAGTGPIGSTANTQALIDGITSAQSELLGWNNEVRDNEVTTAVVRTSDAVVTITLTASLLYDVTADETITVTIPAAVLTGGVELTGTSTIDVTATVVSTVKGRAKKRKRYIVEVDNQLFDVNSIAEADAVLAQVRELADESALRDVKTPTTPKPPRVRIKTRAGKQTTSQALQRSVKRTQKTITQAYVRRSRELEQDLEISTLLVAKIEREAKQDEDAIMRLLM